MKVLVLNCGSSSIKYQLIDMENENLMAKGYLEKIGLPDSFLTHTVNGEKHKIEKVITNHEDGIKLVLGEIKFLIAKGKILLVPKSVIRNSAKFIGHKVGYYFG